MILLLKRAVSFCPFSPGHILITFPELTFKCTFTTSEDSKPIHLETIPGKLRTKRAYFHLHGLQDCHCQDKMARSARREERWDSPCSSWGPSSSSCHPGICLLRHIFYSETQIQLLQLNEITPSALLMLGHSNHLISNWIVCFILV